MRDVTLKILIILSISLVHSSLFAKSYYQPWQFTPEEMTLIKVKEGKIEPKLLPKQLRDQGRSPSCAPHAVLDALGILINSQTKEHVELDPWAALQAFENGFDEKRAYPYSAEPVSFALFLRENFDAMRVFSGKSVSMCLETGELGIPEEKLPINIPEFNILTWDGFETSEEFLKMIRSHFFSNEGKNLSESLIIATAVDDDGPGHTINLVGVKELTYKNAGGEIITKLVGRFRNSHAEEQSYDLDLEALAEGIIERKMGFSALQACGKNGQPVCVKHHIKPMQIAASLGFYIWS